MKAVLVEEFLPFPNVVGVTVFLGVVEACGPADRGGSTLGLSLSRNVDGLELLDIFKTT